MREFTSEDDLKTFDGWMRYQGFDKSSLDAEQLQVCKKMFDHIGHRGATRPKVGLMKLRAAEGEHRYAVALRNITAKWSHAAHDWKEAMNQFAILYQDRFTRVQA